MQRFANCAEALQALTGGLDHGVCHSFDEVRQVATCAAWHRYGAIDNTKTFGDHMREAWSQIRADCGSFGGITPEGGFLQAVGAHHDPEGNASIRFAPTGPTPTDVYEIRHGGQRVGVLVREGDGAVTACYLGSCRQLARPGDGDWGPAAVEAMRDLLGMQGYQVVRA